jgi:predicted AAA+ superfamily ATPase
MIGHPKMGAIWEGYAIEETIRVFESREENCFYWRTENGAELDLLLNVKGKKVGFEFNFSDSARLTKSIFSL